MSITQIAQQFQPYGVTMALPSPGVAPWVQCYWALDSTLGRQPILAEKLYPDAGSSLILEFRPNENRALVSLNTETQWHSFDRPFSLLSVRFVPGGLKRLLGLPVHELPAGFFSVDDIAPQLASEIEQLMHPMRETDTRGQIDCLEMWFLDKLNAADWVFKTPSKEQKYARILHELQTTEDLQQLATNLCMQRKTLQRNVKEAIGINPKTYFMMRKMKAARTMLGSGQTLVDTALALGFYDQAHFHHSFESFTLESPGAYQKRKMSQNYKKPDRDEGDTLS